MRIWLLRATLLAAFAACASLAAPDEDSAAEAAAALPPRAERGVHEPDVVEAAAWAVEQLRELSDSGVYTTLSLARIAAAASQPGVFHDNLFLGLELASPHLASGRAADAFDVVVMRHRDDGVRSLAIDEFPEMTDDAIEQFWIEKVERQRAAREVAFARLELEALALEKEGAMAADAAGGGGGDDAMTLDTRTSTELLRLASDGDVPAARRARAEALLDERWERERIATIVELSELATSALAALARDAGAPLARQALAAQLLKERLSGAAAAPGGA